MHRLRITMFLLTAILLSASAHSQLPLEFFLPAGAPQGKIIRHTGYTLHYSPQYRQAAWTLVQLTRARAQGTVETPEDYRPDPEVTAGAVAPLDLQGTGFDRGMLVPPGNLRWSKTAAGEAYLMSNVSPMRPAFRRGLWAEFEKMTRAWAVANEEIYIVTGPVLKEGLSPAGKSGVPAPEQFFAAVLDNREPEIKAVGFVFPNGQSKKALLEYAVSVDEVERITGLNLFANLPDQMENAFEAVADTSRWSAGETVPGGPFAAPGAPGQRKLGGKVFTPAVMCKGVTAEGKRCVRMTTNPNGYCWEHQDQAKKKTPVKR